VGPRSGLDTVSKRNFPTSRRESNTDLPARSPTLYGLSYPGSHKEIKSKLNSGNAYYLSVQNILSSRLPLETFRSNKIYRIIRLPFILRGYEVWSLTLREGQTLRVFDKGVLK
jgi:hypothetical protein